MDLIKSNLEKLDFTSIDLELGNPIQFSDNKGVLIPIVGNTSVFQNLSATILSGIVEKPRNQEPHITLAHPRNSNCTNEIFKAICK